MGPRRRKRVEPEHREPAAFVKRRARAIPPIPGERDRVSIATEVWGVVPATYFIIYNEARALTNGPELPAFDPLGRTMLTLSAQSKPQ